MKLTKQGVRDLNYIKGPPAGKKLPMPPQGFGCKHKHVEEDLYGNFKCDGCGEYVEVNYPGR